MQLAGIRGPPGPLTDQSDLVRDFLNFVDPGPGFLKSPGPIGSGPRIPDY